jgi:hypothetical protein
MVKTPCLGDHATFIRQPRRRTVLGTAAYAGSRTNSADNSATRSLSRGCSRTSRYLWSGLPLCPLDRRGVGSLFLPVRDAAAFLAYEAHAPVLGYRELHSLEFWTSLGSPIGSAESFQQAVLLLPWAWRDAQASQTDWRGRSSRREGCARGFDEVMRHGGHIPSGMRFSFPIPKRLRIGQSCALKNAAGMHGG